MYAVLRIMPLICSISLDRPKHALGSVKTLAISHRPNGNAAISYTPMCVSTYIYIYTPFHLYLRQFAVAVVDIL